MESQKFNDGTHDMGFKIFSSFGEGLKVAKDSSYKDVIVQSAKTLATRFNENVGSLRSWDFNADEWEFPVIVDNMMNLELLFEATKITDDSTFYDIAVKHANTTLKNHIRENNSIYHVVVYDTVSGAVKDKVTHQGFNDESSWARGQAWGIYGFTMAYRYTQDTTYLNQAEATANYYLSQENLPEDGIPYWDFDDPKIPDAVRDVSAATIIASAFFELDRYTDDPKYLVYANKVLDTLKSKEYLLPADVDAPFILDHSTGNWPKKDEMDGPVYADYYFLEALLRKQEK
jgi:rhamnogalacturonyl hydrolase YesR